jgi:hypothetical protein
MPIRRNFSRSPAIKRNAEGVLIIPPQAPKRIAGGKGDVKGNSASTGVAKIVNKSFKLDRRE